MSIGASRDAGLVLAATVTSAVCFGAALDAAELIATIPGEGYLPIAATWQVVTVAASWESPTITAAWAVPTITGTYDPTFEED